MSKQAQQFLESAKQQAQPEQSKGVMETIKDGLQAVAPGLSLDKFFSDITTELKQQVKHGAHEVASALFNGSAFVMYPRQDNQREDPQHGLPAEAVKQPEVQPEVQKEQDQGMGY